MQHHRNARPVQMTAALAALATALLLLAPGVASAQGGKAEIAVPDGVFADTATASVTVNGGTDYDDDVWVRAWCYQDGELVYQQHVRTDGGEAVLTLGPTPSWDSGAADCDAEAGIWHNNRWKRWAGTSFQVSAA